MNVRVRTYRYALVVVVLALVVGWAGRITWQELRQLHRGFASVQEYLCRALGIRPGETTADGMFTILPVCCVGYCDRAPAMLVNRRVHGYLTPEKIAQILADCRRAAQAG